MLLLVIIAAGAAAVLWQMHDDADVWRISVEIEGEGTADPMEAVVEDGGSVMISLTPAEGWVLSAVYLDGVPVDLAGDELPVSDVRGDRTVRAVFVEEVPMVLYTLMVFSNAGGSTEPYGTTSHPAGSVVRVTVSPDAGFRISDVRLDGVSVGTPSHLDVEMDSDRTVEAVFEAEASPRMFAVTASATSGGTISPSGTLQVEEGGSIAFAMTASSGYRLSALLVDGVSVGTPSTYTLEDIRGDRTVRAVFSPVPSPPTPPSPGPSPSPTPEGISVTAPPERTSYIEGERFDPSGMVVTARYSDGSSAPVTGYTWSPAGPLSVSDSSVSIRYDGRTCEQAVTVSPWMTLTVQTPPSTLVYDIGDEFDSTGAEILAVYPDGRTEDVTSSCVFSVDTGSEGTKDVLVTYSDGTRTASTTFPVYVAPSGGFSAAVESVDGSAVSIPLSDYELNDPMAPGQSRVLEIRVSNGTSMAVSPYLHLERVRGSDDMAAAVSVSCGDETFTVLQMGDGLAIELDDIPSGGDLSVQVTISVDPSAGNELMREDLSFRLGIFAEGVPPTGGS